MDVVLGQIMDFYGSTFGFFNIYGKETGHGLFKKIRTQDGVKFLLWPVNVTILIGYFWYAVALTIVELHWS